MKTAPDFPCTRVTQNILTISKMIVFSFILILKLILKTHKGFSKKHYHSQNPYTRILSCQMNLKVSLLKSQISPEVGENWRYFEY